MRATRAISRGLERASIVLALFLFSSAALAQGDSGSAVARARTHTSKEAPRKVLVLFRVTVIDVTAGTVHPDMAVEIDGNRIASVGKIGSLEIPKGAVTLNMRGKFLIPGLWDMHVHTFFGDWVPGGREVTLPLFVASGITGVRDMGSDLDQILAARDAVEQGLALGPRLVVSGPMLDGPKSQFPASIGVGTQAEAIAAVDMLKARGVDFIKVQSYIPREAYFAVADETKKDEIAFEGHVPDAIRATEAVAAGQRSFEHLIGVFEGSSTAEDELLKGAKGPGKFLETYDPAKEASLIELLAKTQTWQCPTLYWERGQWLVDSIDISKDPNLKYAPATWRDKSWPTFTKSIIKNLDTDPLAVREKFVDHELDIVRTMHKAGVPFLAGTDCPAGVDLIPGFSLHQELERFVAAGFTPAEALETATINPAKFLERTQDFGTVEKGKFADLVVLDANPLDDIRNTEKIDAVILNGRFFSRQELDSILRQVEAVAKTE
jgi:imidazolonepropionase-like amidohydrolase